MTVDTQRLRECLYAYGMHRSTSILMEIISAVLDLLDEIERLRTRLEIGEDAPEWDGIACRDETIRQQDAEIARLRAQLEYTDRYAMDSIRTASRDLDDWHGDMLHLSNSARAALSPTPGNPTPTGVSK